MPPVYPLLRSTTPQADPGLPHTTPISNKAELQAINTNLDGNYYLTNNIDATGAAWTPLGRGPGYLEYFIGTFDGCGFTVDGLNLSASGSYKGLFGSVKGPGKVANVNLTNVNIEAESYTGALAGEVRSSATDSPLIQNCHASGIIKCKAGRSNYQMGGLIGGIVDGGAMSHRCFVYDSDCSCEVNENGGAVLSQYGGFVGMPEYATIENCFATGNVIGGTKVAAVGGFVGEIPSNKNVIIRFCHATGSVTGKENLGGFVGGHSNAPGVGIIERCYATGNVTHTAAASVGNVGGFVGRDFNGGDIKDCWASGNASSNQAAVEVGGFAGQDLTAGLTPFVNCYSKGNAAGLSDPGGFIGRMATSLCVHSYWDTEASGNPVSAGGEGRTTAQMGKKATFVGWDFVTIWLLSGSRQLIMGRPRTSYPIRAKHTAQRNVFG